MAAALAAPPRVRLEMQPAIVRPGRSARLVASVRPTELSNAQGDRGGGSFAIEAHVTDPRGRDDIVRLHPTMESGTLEGSVPTSLPGVYGVTVLLANGARSQTTFVAANDASVVSASADDLERVPDLTGGVVVASSDLAPLVQHLLETPRPSRRVAAHPTRSAWWMVAFTAALCAEWTLRRRRGLR
jgi:hypothetical protein